MSAHVLLNLFKELRKKDEMRALHPHIFGIQTPGAVARLEACLLCMQTVQI